MWVLVSLPMATLVQVNIFLSFQDILATTSDYPESLSKTIDAIKEMVPVEVPLPPFTTIFASQEATSGKMAEQLESLAHHYDNMSNALHDFEAGEEFGEEDIKGAAATIFPTFVCVHSVFVQA